MSEDGDSGSSGSQDSPDVLSQLNPVEKRTGDQARKSRRGLRTSGNGIAELFDDSLDAHIALDRRGRVIKANRCAMDLLGSERESLLGRPFVEFVHQDSVTEFLQFLTTLLETESRRSIQLRLQAGTIPSMAVEIHGSSEGHSIDQSTCRLVIVAISQQSPLDGYHRFLEDLHTTMNKVSSRRESISQITDRLVDWLGCDAVGIRLKDGDDYPYYESRGFPEEFVELENTLCLTDEQGRTARDGNGNPVLECMCGNIICGRFDPTLPFFTPGGSFWSSCTTKLLASTTEADRQTLTRNRCNDEGYESVGLFPLRYGETTYGLLQVNDRREGFLSKSLASTLEMAARNIASALALRLAIADQASAKLDYERIIELALEGVLVLDHNRRLKYVNPQMAAMLGLNVSDIVGRSIFDFIFREDLPAYEERMKERAAGKANRYMQRFRHADGHGVCCIVSPQVLREKDGSFAGSYGLVSDVTENLRMQNTIEGLLRGSSGTGEEFMQRFARHVGWAFKAKAVHISELLPGAAPSVRTLGLCIDGRSATQAEHDLMGTPAHAVLESGQCFYPGNVRNLFPEDRLLADTQAQAYWGMLLKSAQDEPIGILSIIFNQPLAPDALTEKLLGVFSTRAAAELDRHLEERQRNQSEYELKTIFDNAPVMIFMFDGEMRARQLNPLAIDFGGGTSAELIGKPCGDILGCLHIHDHVEGCGHGTACEVCAVRLSLQKTLRTGIPQAGILFQPSVAFGQPRTDCWIRASTARIEIRGQHHALLFAEDVTEPEKARQQIRRGEVLLESIHKAQSMFIAGDNIRLVFGELLGTLVHLTDSEYGFMEEVTCDENGILLKANLAISDISWDEKSRALYHDLVNRDFRFEMKDDLASAPAISGKIVIANNVAQDARSGGIPEGHPQLRSFMGIPIYFNEKVVGVAGLANRPGGYTEQMAEFFEPFIRASAAMIHTMQATEQEQKLQAEAVTRERQLSAIADSVNESIVLLERDGSVSLINRTGAKRFGKEPDELIGCLFYEHLDTKLAASRRQIVDGVFRSGSPAFAEDTRDDRHIEHSVYPIVNDRGGVDKVVAFSRDITERKLAEENLRESEAKLIASNLALEEEKAALKNKTLVLKELLDHIEEERNRTRSEILTNKERAIDPLLKSIQRKSPNELVANIEKLKQALDDIVSPFANNVSRRFASLSPREVEVSVMIKNGLMSKEIADYLCVSIQTVHKFRQRIRKKLGISNDEVDLTDFLKAL